MGWRPKISAFQPRNVVKPISTIEPTMRANVSCTKTVPTLLSVSPSL